MFRHLLVSDAGPIRTLVVNRPESLNALNGTLYAELAEAVGQAAADGNIRAIVLTGAGGKAFVAGADIRAMLEATPAQAEALSRQGKATHDQIRRCPKPVIAAINGYCLGGGLELALACDIRIAADSASFGLPEIKLGILPGGGGTVRLSRVIGSGPARALCLTGATIGAERALALGLVSDVVPAAGLPAAATKLAATLAGYSPTALGQLKAVLDRVGECDLETAETIEAKAFALCFAGPDQREGMSAFLEKRPPVFGAV